MKTVLSLLVVVVLIASAPLRAQDKKSDAKFDAAKLVGKWEYVSGVKNGEKVAQENLKDQVITITKDKITLKGKDTFVFKYDLDTEKKPVGIKLEILESPFGPGAKSAGVIELKGDEIRLCYAAMDDAATPKTFEAKEGSKAHLFVLKRTK